jgi:hypothetical protein
VALVARGLDPPLAEGCKVQAARTKSGGRMSTALLDARWFLALGSIAHIASGAANPSPVADLQSTAYPLAQATCVACA